MIELIGVSKSFFKNGKEYNVIHEVDLTVRKGEITGIVGFSGAGKSTLIRLVNLLERPDKGFVKVNGVELTTLNPKQLAFQRGKIGMIFQHFNLLSSKTVFENIALPLKLKGYSKKKIIEKVFSLIQLVGLEDKTEEYPKYLSGGQKQRVAIARALANDPEILLCDEATSALDSVTTQSILILLKDLNQKLQIPIILVTHELDVVTSICDTLVLLENGRIIENNTVHYVIKNSNHAIIRQHKENFSSIDREEIELKSFDNAIVDSFTELDIKLDSKIRLEEILYVLVHKFNVKYLFKKIELDESLNGSMLIRLQGSDVEKNKFINNLLNKKVDFNIRENA